MDAPILRTHLHVPWASIKHSRKRGHMMYMCAHILREFGYPFAPINHVHAPTRNWWSMHAHIYPHQPTKFWMPKHADELPRFRQTWTYLDGHKSSTQYHGRPRDIGQPCDVMGTHEVLCTSTRLYGQPRQFVGAHTHNWVSMSYYGHPCVSHGRPIMRPDSRILVAHDTTGGLPC